MCPYNSGGVYLFYSETGEYHENAKVVSFMEINGCGGIVYYDLT